MRRSTSHRLVFVALAAVSAGWVACGGDGANGEGSAEEDAAPAVSDAPPGAGL